MTGPPRPADRPYHSSIYPPLLSNNDAAALPRQPIRLSYTGEDVFYHDVSQQEGQRMAQHLGRSAQYGEPLDPIVTRDGEVHPSTRRVEARDELDIGQRFEYAGGDVDGQSRRRGHGQGQDEGLGSDHPAKRARSSTATSAFTHPPHPPSLRRPLTSTAAAATSVSTANLALGSSESTKSRARGPKNGKQTSARADSRRSTSQHAQQADLSQDMIASTVTSETKEADSSLSVLTREKKQKACSNCRKAKLRCMMDDGAGECVRCKARGEKCVFYPRTQNDDWQQNLSQDVYTALTHLSALSAAVHHLIEHLSSSGHIPPLSQPLPRYVAPERDGAIQGWTADVNRELPGPSMRNAAGGGSGRSASMSRQPGSGNNPFRENQDQVQSQDLKQADSSRQLSGHGPSQAQGDDALPSLNDFGGPLGPDMPPYWDGSLAPIDQQSMGVGSGLTYTNDDLDTGVPLDVSLPHSTHPSRPAGLSAIDISPTISLRDPLNNLSHPSANAFPTPVLNHPAIPAPPFPLSSPSQSKLSPNRLFAPARLHSSTFMDFTDHPNDKQECGPLISLLVVPGIDDQRQNVIKKGLIDARDAVKMLNYSHQHLSKLLFGYRLELGRFPYLPAGASTITPLILAVLCLLGAERISYLNHYKNSLYAAVKTLLLESPAESWQQLAHVTKNANVSAGNNGVNGTEDGDELDPELGIGPEEIVAAAVLSLWIQEKKDSLDVASVAFSWARGWIRLLTGPPRNSIAEIAGIVPAERIASPAEMARVWLLCFLAEGCEAVLRHASMSVLRDPEQYCLALLPPPNSPIPATVDPHDIILVIHARMLRVFTLYLSTFADILKTPASEKRDRELQRMTAGTDARIQSLREVLDERRMSDHPTIGVSGQHHNHGNDAQASSFAAVPETWVATKLLDLFASYARVRIHQCVTDSNLAPRQKGASMGVVMDVGMDMMEKWNRWLPRDEITNLPEIGFAMIASIGRLVCENIVKAGTTSNGCVVQPSEAWPLFLSLADMLHLGNLGESHSSRLVGDLLRRDGLQLRSLSAAV